ncbi:MurR/RpiR family transcriptional regulator [Bacillus massiliigorillae]|uniref:MurR/RpiR family transcriptional regulator n=1 Tax=Bacillus massiliigorillae TaxID=1243664 RepID=UPI001E5E6DC3|nr:MurR/RpiR family transcriptional regulator [Bacillus massiliigorillae]
MHSSILSRIETMINELPISEQTIGKYILAHPASIVKMTIHELAENAGGSSAAVVRFCRSIGLDGFPDLKIRLSAESKSPKKPSNYDIERDENAESVIEKLVSLTVQTLYNTASQLNRDVIEESVKLIKQASVIYVYGIGASTIVAQDFAQKWMRLGKHVVTNTDTHVMAMAMAVAPADSVCVSISYSGETPEVLQLTHIAKEQDMKVIGISRFSQNKLSQLADYMLYTAQAPEAELRTAATSSRMAQLLVIDVLFFTYATEQYDYTIEQLTKTRQVIDQYKRKK